MAYNINVSPWMTGSANMAAAIEKQGEGDAAKIKSRTKGLETAAGLALSALSGGAAGAGISSVLNAGPTGMVTSMLSGGLLGSDPRAGAATGLSSFLANNAAADEQIMDSNGNKLGKKGGYGSFGGF